MKFGLVITGMPCDVVSPREQFRRELDLVRCARDSGFSMVSVGQHFLAAPYRYHQPIPFLAAAIPESGDMRLATTILLLSMLNPVQVAEEIATLDIMSDGRMVMGVGLGYRDEEFRAFGLSRSARVARTVEALEVIQKLWRGGAIDHSGEYYDVVAAGSGIRPLQSPGPPIWMAAMAEVSLMRALQHGYTPLLGPRIPKQKVEEWARTLVDDQPIVLRRELFIAGGVHDDRDVIRHVGERFKLYREWGLESSDVDGETQDFGQYLQDRIVAGTPGQCLDSLFEYEMMGVDTVIFRCNWPGMSYDAALGMVRAAGASLLPPLVAGDR